MWIRIACPNGHTLDQRELRFAVRSGNCPKCMATVSMWIKIACPNGHHLRVRTKHGGRKGRCPQCGAETDIPLLTEDTIVAMLGQMAPAAATVPDTSHDSASIHDDIGADGEGSSLLTNSMLKRMPKTCPTCKQQVSHKYTICPHCRTYLPFTDVGEAAEVSGHAAILNCPSCGAKSFPGSTVCNNCGVSFLD